MENSSWEESFLVMKDHFVGPNGSSDAANPAHLILFAENAAKEGHSSLAEECLDLFFSLNPPTNQFLIRAHLCRALVVTAGAPSCEPEEGLQRALESIVNAVDIAKKSECYHFLVHNASVLLWEICRPHRRPGWTGLCVRGWQSVAKALETVREDDHSWRLDILLALLESQVDAGLKEEAVKTCTSALQLARKKLPDRHLGVVKLCLFYGLGEGKSAERELKSVPEFPVVSKLYKLKHSLSMGCHGKQGDVESQLRKLVETLTAAKSPARKTPAAPNSKTSPQTTFSQESKAEILLEIAQVCVEVGYLELGGECVAGVLQEEEVGSGSRLNLLRIIVRAQLALLKSTAGLPLYSRAAVKVREQTIAQLENCLTAAQRLGDQELVQHVCVILWGVCLPLLQPNLRSRLSHVLSGLASALEQVDSLQHGMRCGVHMELAKVCADQDQLQSALEHINKAREQDRECEWSEQLRWLGQRLRLRSELYTTPPSSLQQATQLLEQVKSVGGFDSKEERRAVLVKVGALLAPNHFTVAIGDKTLEPSQNEGDGVRKEGEEAEEDGGKEEEGEEGRCEGVSGGGVSGVASESGDSEYPGVPGVREEEEGETETTERVGQKVYEVLKQQIEAHKMEVGCTDDADRCRLWADLAKFARKCHIWDVAFVSAKFCLIYDDQRWTVSPVKTAVQPSKAGSKSKLQKSSSVSVTRSRSDVSTRSSSLSVAAGVSGPAAEREAGRQRGRERLCRELLRTLATTHFIHAECAVYQLKEGGHYLGDGLSPQQPPTSEQQVPDNTENLVVWPGSLSSDAYSSFQRGGELGVCLCEPWLVANAATYLCNYSQHLLETGALSRLAPVFRPLLASLTSAGRLQLQNGSQHTIGADLLCHVSTVLAGGLVQKWTPSPPDPTQLEPTSKENPGGRKSGRGTATGKKKGGGGEGQLLQVSPESGPELEEALGVCERALDLARELPLALRAPLLATWVRCKQLLHQPIPSKTLGVEEKDGGGVGVGEQARGVVAVEMLSLLGNRIWDFPDCPTLTDAFDLVTCGKWSGEDSILELELLTRTARLALLQKNYSLVGKCANQALVGRAVEDGEKKEGEKKKNRKKKGKKDTRCERELLSCICSLHAQALVVGGAGRAVAARAAMEAFLHSAQYGRDAGSYQCAIEAARHYWNVCRELTGTPVDRESLRQPLTALLSILTSFLPSRSSQHSPGQEDVCEEDLQLHVAIYSVLFQIFIDKGEWAEGMKAVEGAMWVTPRSIHQELAEYKLIFKSQMGKDVAADMIRFQDAPEEERARLWYRVACNSSHPRLQLTAFQNSINTLTSPEYVWMKVDYLLALSEWLYSHQFPVEDALSHLKWALSLLLGAERGEEEEEEGGKEATPECGVSAREKAVHILVMMARLQGKGSGGHRESCLAALAHCCLIWKAILNSYSESVSGKTSATLPSSVQEWVDFTFTDELKDFVRSGEGDNGCSNPHVIRTPGLTVHYLGALSDELCGSGLQSLALPTETLRLLLVDSLVLCSATSQLIKLRLATVCDVIGAQSAAEKYRKLTGPPFLNPDDMARVRAEIAHYQQKQAMAKREEPVGKSSSESTAREEESRTLSARESTGPVLHRVWVETAALLVKQGQCEVARELLQEAKVSSQVLGDREAMGRLVLTKASLAAAEKRVSDCIAHVCEALRYPLRLEEWEDVLGLLLKVAASSSPSLRDSAVSAVAEALDSSLLRRNSNERQRLETVQATLQARLAVVKAELILNCTEKDRDKLEKLCQEMFVHTKDSLQVGRCEEAARVMLDQSRITMRALSSSTDDGDASHKASLLRVLELVKGAVDALQSGLKDNLSLCQLPDGLYTAGEGMLVEAEIEMASILLIISERYVEDERRERLKQGQKSSTQQMIDDYIRVAPEPGSAEDVWNLVASVAAEKPLSVLASLLTRSVVQSQTQLKARCMYGSGRAQLLMGRQANPESPCEWKQSREAPGTDGVAQTVSGGGGGVMGTVTESQRDNLSQGEGREVSKAEIAESESVQYLAAGSQSLREALGLALQARDMEVATKAAMKIVDSCGTSDAKSTALHLAVYQSCVASQGFLKLLGSVLSDPSQSKLAALLHQYSQFTSSPSPPSLPPPPLLLETLNEQLNTYTCWHRLGVSADYWELLKHFPPHFRFLVLQHSDDKSHLYSAYLIPPQPPPPAAKKGGPPPVSVCELPVVARLAVSAEDRERLVNLVHSSHTLQAQQLLRPLGESSPADCVMNQQFNSIMEAMEHYLRPALEQISAVLQDEKADQGLTIVLLADFDLLQLPLEALSLLQIDRVKAVSRDFSLQMQYHRIKKFLVEEEAAVSTTNKGKFQLQPSLLQSNTTNFKYILDPRCELSDDSGNEGQQPVSKIMSQISAFPKITAKWSGHRGTTTEQAMSSSQWYPIVEQCSEFLFLGSERLAAHFPPRQLASLSMQDCSVAIVMDHVHTLKSSLTQSKLDLHKSREEMEAEQSLQTAALLSLAGVSCLLSRQWSSTVDSCTDTMCSFIKKLLSNGVSVADVKWSEIREQKTVQELPAEPSKEQKEPSSVFNCIVYGLPHLALTLPNQ